ncbi:PIH1 domain-containing protein 2 [Corythoichthys intestinalis]|uniref:PIH1 domain-containing protein 2 n=1 Tax=Corythoichthys intestinalis TaxID=161448 RepID=UPI0025A5D116|nr:PIH1 domain-containing protein 2 [Corythoichthys intestinalis]XP_057695195.1 PIH1 domain-containing protein 2 [Corythoichthys intestinalis]XP_061796865.1 PIH1 domain-containing protein 2-like [Nerophis lumbriciformis]
MSSSSSTGDVLQQVNQLWSMLDDLCENDPEAYRRFMEKQVKSGMEYNAPPQLDSCICVDMLEPQGGSLYINICSWKRVPASQDPSKPLPVYAGSLEAHTDEGAYTVLDIAFNPEVLQQSKKDKAEMDQIYKLALSFAQQQHGLKLSQQYNVVSFCPKNCPEDLCRRLSFQQQRLTADKQSDSAIQSPESLLQKISSLRLEKDDKADIVRQPAVRKKSLIEVISSTTNEQPEKPEYRLEVRADAEGFPCKLELTVDLPKISSMSEWQLKMSKDDVLLEVEDIYYLLLDFPKAVNENSAVAIFNKRSRKLTVTADIL